MTASQPQEAWTSGASYQGYVGRWSRPVGRVFLDWLALRPERRWLDVGCGTGVLSHVVLSQTSPVAVTGIDRAPGYVAFARRQVGDPRASFAVGDAQALPVRAAIFDVAVSGLVLNFVPDPRRMVVEMMRAVRQDGTVALYVWDYAGQMALLRYFWDAAAALDPRARALDEGVRFPICQPEPLAALFREAGLENVAVRAIDVPTGFVDFDDYWRPFLSGEGPAPGYTMSLPAADRAALRERIRATLPNAADGAIHLTARAWAVRGLRA